MLPSRVSRGLLAAALSLPALSQPSAQTGGGLSAFSPIIPGEFIVQMDRSYESLARTRFESLGATVSAPAGSSIAVVRQPAFESLGTEAAMARLAAVPGVRRVEPNFRVDRYAVPNDPLAEQMWMIRAMEADRAWGVVTDASEVLVAVIDDAVQTDHEDLAANIWTNAGEIPGNGVDDDGNGYVDDVHGYDFGDNDGDPRPDAACWAKGDSSAHGTHVAGTVGAVGNNGVGVVGMAPRVRIMGLKVTRRAEQAGEPCQFGAGGAILAAIEYAVNNGARIINMSLGGPLRSEIQRELLTLAAQRDIAIVVAAGNDGADIDPEQPYALVLAVKGEDGKLTPRALRLAPAYPAAWDLPTQITVAATEAPDAQGPKFVASWYKDLFWTHIITGLRYREDGWIDESGAQLSELAPGTVAPGSNYGQRRVHVAAPGKDILSTIPDNRGGALASGYGLNSGTSMASPAVAGAVALIRSAFPEMTAVQVRERVIATADRSPSLQTRTLAGGEINLYAALCAPGAPRALAGCDGAGTGMAGGTPAPGQPVGGQPAPGQPAPGQPVGGQPVAGGLPAGVASAAPVIPGEYVVQMDQSFESLARSRFESLGARVSAPGGGSSIAVVRAPGFESMGAAAAMARLAEIPGVRRVEPNFEYSLDSDRGDPLADRMWMIAAMEADKAWGVIDDASQVVVAVIDDAVQTDHEDLAGNIWVNPGEIAGNGVDDDGNGYVDDVHGFDFGDSDGDPRPDAHCFGERGGTTHGTHVAGTVGAVGNNGVGVVGMAPRVRIMALKTTRSPQQAGEGCRFLPSGTVLAAIEYATRNGANVITMSLSSAFRSQIQLDLLTVAAQRNISITTSASNDGLDIDPDVPSGALIGEAGADGKLNVRHIRFAPVYPAAWDLPTQLTIAATEPPDAQGPKFVAQWGEGYLWTHVVTGLRRKPDGDIDFTEARTAPVDPGQLPIGSNYGQRRVHIGAPGKDILSTIPENKGGTLVSAYGFKDGTSMSTPAVAGAVALIRAAFPEMTAAQVRERVIATADRSPSLEKRTLAGGEINLYAALCAPGAPRALEGCGGGTPAVSAITPQPARAAVAPVQAAPVGRAPAPAETGGAVNLNQMLGE